MQVPDAAAAAWRGGCLARAATATWSPSLQRAACSALLDTLQQAFATSSNSMQVSTPTLHTCGISSTCLACQKIGNVLSLADVQPPTRLKVHDAGCTTIWSHSAWRVSPGNARSIDRPACSLFGALIPTVLCDVNSEAISPSKSAIGWWDLNWRSERKEARCATAWVICCCCFTAALCMAWNSILRW